MRIALFILLLVLSLEARCHQVSAIVAETYTGRIIFQHDANKIRHPASLTKMMTLYLMFDALEAGRISLKDKIKFSNKAAAQPRSKLDIPAGQSITVEEAILSLIVVSANDVAQAVAEWMGGGDEHRFVGKMNAKARSLGMSDTVFKNAHGLHHSLQVTTTKDMAKLAICLRLNHPNYYHYFSNNSFNFRGRRIAGHNSVTSKYKEVDGLKTGYIKEAGYNLATSVSNEKLNIVSVIMGGESAQTRDALMGFLIDTVATKKTGRGLTKTIGDATKKASSKPNKPVKNYA